MPIAPTIESNYKSSSVSMPEDFNAPETDKYESPLQRALKHIKNKKKLKKPLTTSNL